MRKMRLNVRLRESGDASFSMNMRMSFKRPHGSMKVKLDFP